MIALFCQNFFVLNCLNCFNIEKYLLKLFNNDFSFIYSSIYILKKLLNFDTI